MENEEYLTNIWSRIKGKGSCSIVLAEDQESVAVVTAILDSLKADLTEAHIVPDSSIANPRMIRFIFSLIGI